MYWPSSFLMRSSYFSRICSLSGGVTMSFFEIETPEREANRKPRSLIVSRIWATWVAPCWSTSHVM